MTYFDLEQFKSLFRSESNKYRLDGNGASGRPSSSDYSKHLNGEAVLSLEQRDCRFCVSKVLGGSVPANTPLVEFKNGEDSYCAIFLKSSIPNPSEQLLRMSRYYLLELSIGEFIDLPFFRSELEFSPLDDSKKPFRLLERALEFCLSKAVSVADIDEWERNLPFNDAPFCIQSYYLINGKLPDYAAPYLDAKGLPIEGEERASWWTKNTAPYSCEGKPCDKAMCLSRKYGLGKGEVSELEFGQLTQYKDDPVFYVWEINGDDVRFDHEADIIRQERFLSLCMRKIGRLPHRMTNERWLQTINKALNNMKVIGGGDASQLTIDAVRDIIIEDLKDRVLVSTYYEHERLMQGFIYLDPSSSTFVVEPRSLCSYITGRFKDKRIDGIRDFMAVLKHLGFRGKNRSIDGINKSLWYIRTEYMFKNRAEWKKYMLSVSEGTAWEMNFKAFLEDEADEPEAISQELMDEIAQDAAIFLDTEKGEMYDKR